MTERHEPTGIGWSDWQIADDHVRVRLEPSGAVAITISEREKVHWYRAQRTEADALSTLLYEAVRQATNYAVDPDDTRRVVHLRSHAAGRVTTALGVRCPWHDEVELFGFLPSEPAAGTLGSVVMVSTLYWENALALATVLEDAVRNLSQR